MTLDSELPSSIGEMLNKVRKILSRSPALVERRLVETESEQILSSAFRKVTGVSLSRVDIHASGRDAFPSQAARIALEMAHDRSEGAILQHLMGSQEFLGHEYDVGPDVLVPRPETEFLAFIALERLKREMGLPQTGIEIGLGSGILSIELLAQFSTLEIWASEVSRAAEERAQANAIKILGRGASRLHVLRPADSRDVWSPFSGQSRPADFLISNPPYLIEGDEVDPEVRENEPHLALFAPSDDPLHFYREIATRAGQYLVPRGWAFLEVPHERAREINELFRHESWYTELSNDLTGRERVLSANRERF